MMRLLACLFVLVSTPAFAQEVALTIEGACPARDQVVDALDRLAPKVLIVDDPVNAALSVEVTDLGDRYRVVGGFNKTIEDATRRCDERARSTALMVALAIDSLPPPEAPPPPSLPPSPVLRSPSIDERPGPLALIDRPLILPRLHTQVTEELGFAWSRQLVSDGGDVPIGVDHVHGFTETTSADLGLSRSVQVGLLAAVPLTQGSSDVMIIPRVMIGVKSDFAIRIELGFDRTRTIDADNNSRVVNGGFFGIALIVRERLHRMLTLTFGDTGQRTEVPVTLGKYGSDFLAITSHALLAVSGNAASVNVTVCVPMGVIFQPHPVVAIQVTGGLRLRFNQNGLALYESGFPISVDLVVSPHPNIDLGLSFDAPLQSGAVADLFASAFFLRGRY